MFKKSLWFAIVMSLLMVGVNFVDAKSGSSSSSSSSGFSSGGRSSSSSSSSSSFSSGSKSSGISSSSGFTSGSKSTTPAAAATSGFTSGSKATVPSGFTSGSKSGTTPSSATTSSGKTDMMSKSVQQERSNSVYSATDKPASASGASTANAGSLPPSVIGGKTTVIRDRSSGPSWFPIPIFLGGSSGGDHTTVINNGQPATGTPGYVEVQGNDDTRSKEIRSWSIFFFILGIGIIGSVIYSVVKRSRNQ